MGHATCGHDAARTQGRPTGAVTASGNGASAKPASRATGHTANARDSRRQPMAARRPMATGSGSGSGSTDTDATSPMATGSGCGGTDAGATNPMAPNEYGRAADVPACDPIRLGAAVAHEWIWWTGDAWPRVR